MFADPTDRAGLELAVRNGATVLAHVAPLMDDESPGFARRVALTPTLSLFEAQP